MINSITVMQGEEMGLLKEQIMNSGYIKLCKYILGKA
jgi:hypothetical protein